MMSSLSRYVRVLLPYALDQAFDYALPPSLSVKIGDLVEVTFRRQRQIAVVVAVDVEPEIEASKVQILHGLYDGLSLPASSMAFLAWVAGYTLQPRGLVFKAMVQPLMAIPAGGNQRVYVRSSAPLSCRITPARQRVLDCLQLGSVLSKTDLQREAGVSAGVVDALVDEGVIDVLSLPPVAKGQAVNFDLPTPPLTVSQQEAAQALRTQRAPSVTLLDGPTGSGKTEVYLDLVHDLLAQGKQVLVLLPEIALTLPVLKRFAERFGTEPAHWHNRVSLRQKRLIWEGVARGDTRLVVGARSALFLPFVNLGLVVVDEEHDASYKQDEGFLYHGRDMAVVRAKLAQAPVVLASATPSLETWVNASEGRYGHVVLPATYQNHGLPVIDLLDLRSSPLPKGAWLHPRLVEAMQAGLDKGEQTLLYLNRRGYAPLTLCRACGHRMGCPDCSTWLVEHRYRRSLLCHMCGHTERCPDACPSCGAQDTWVAVGPGVERIAEAVATLFPSARVSLLSSDLVGGTERLMHELEAVRRGDVDVIVGTQVVAKGHTFPHLTLVGVVDADVALNSPDPRAAERTFQVMTQVVGRAGRGAVRGRALLQTYAADHPVLQAIAAYDRPAFYGVETDIRRRAHLPPFSRLALVHVSGPDAHVTEAYAKGMLASWPHPLSHDVRIFGPTPAPVAVVRGRHRFRFLIRVSKAISLQKALKGWLDGYASPPKGLKVHVDIDPYFFL